MNPITLSCCSTADRSREFFESRQIPFAMFHYTMNGKTYQDDLGATIPFDQFYKAIADGATPVTSQVNSDEYIALWEPFMKKGHDILHISLSSGLSGAYNSANIASRELMEQYPGQTIYVVDSLGASSGYGLLMDYLADLRDKGASLEEMRDWAEANRLHMHHIFFSTDLTSYKRGGRITGTEAAIGTILGICPLMNMNNEGKLIPRKKIRTKKKVIEAMVDAMAAHAANGLDYSGKCALSQSACMGDATRVVDLILQRFKNLKREDISINPIGTVIGSHTGPGTVALFFMGDERGE